MVWSVSDVCLNLLPVIKVEILWCRLFNCGLFNYGLLYRRDGWFLNCGLDGWLLDSRLLYCGLDGWLLYCGLLGCGLFFFWSTANPNPRYPRISLPLAAIPYMTVSLAARSNVSFGLKII